MLGNLNLSKQAILEVEHKIDALLQTEMKTLRGMYHDAEVTILSGRWRKRKGIIKCISPYNAELIFTIHPISLKPPHDLLDPIYVNKKGFEL